MAPEAVGRMEQMAAAAPAATPQTSADLDASSAEQDAERLEMSTLSFQDYVRRRMLKRRQVVLDAEARRQGGLDAEAWRPPEPPGPAQAEIPREPLRGSRLDVRVDDRDAHARPQTPPAPAAIYAEAQAAGQALRGEARVAAAALAEPPTTDDPIRIDTAAFDAPGEHRQPLSGIDPERAGELLAEMRSMKGLIEERFGVLAFMEKLQRRPAEARLTQKLLDCGFSPALTRKLAESLPHDSADEAEWAAQVIERNVRCVDVEAGIEARGGVHALVGPTGVGKTTTTAKIAAAFAARRRAWYGGAS